MGLATENETLGIVPRPQHGPGTSQVTPHDHHPDEIATRSLPQNTAPQSENYFQIVARATNDAIRDLDLRTGHLAWPQGLPELLGYEVTPTTNNINFWNDCVHPEDRVPVAAAIRSALANSTEHWNGEYRFRCANGSYLHLLERALIIRDRNGRAERLIGSLMDITERKQLQDQLCRSQKMDAFGQLAGGAAHDFNNFLTTILGYSDLVIAETGDGVVASHVAEIRKAAGRASNLTAQLLAFSRKQALEPKVIELNSLINNLERSVLRLLGDNITVVCHPQHAKEEAHIKVDSGQLTQIILNLAVNARDAMPDGGQLVLETDVVSLGQNQSPHDRQTISGLDDLAPGEYAVIRVIDTGVGMSDEVKAHLFEPFFTTKAEGAGSGLGLATCYGIVRQSGGRIRVDSKLGKGTTVEIYLPRVPAPPPPSYKKPGSKKMPGGTETILVLEDDISVRHISVRVLRSLGYQVTEAANGDDAQRLITESSRDVDLLLTDVVMPQMSGRFFADWLRKVSPRTKIVFVSGYLDESHRAGEQVENGMFFLPKPFDPEQLAQTIRHALDV